MGLGLIVALFKHQLVLTTKKLYNVLRADYSSLKAKENTFFKTYQSIQKIVQKNGGDLDKLYNEMQANFSHFKGYHSNIASYAAYEIFLAQDYVCKEVDENHIIFIPKNLITDDAKNGTRDRFSKLGYEKIPFGISEEDYTLGLLISPLKDYVTTKDSFFVKKKKKNKTQLNRPNAYPAALRQSLTHWKH